MKRKIAILGSTGSIGTQALEVVQANPDAFEVEILTAGSNVELLAEQAVRFNPNVIVIGSREKAEQLKSLVANYPIKVFSGDESIAQVVNSEDIDIVLTAMVGFAGLRPTIAAIKAKKNIALANKETMVVAGKIINDLAKQNHVAILPVDSEHSAIFQCMAGEWKNPIEKIYLTASGGPFRGKNLDFLKNATLAEALKHPNWSMGAKITIDSASMMNKGLEMIEAQWLFNLKPSQIDVIVHPQSIIHSIVQFADGSMKAQMGLPDMKLPIQYALAYPVRLKSDFPRFDFINYPQLTFEKADTTAFRNLALATEAMHKGGNTPCVLNAANEIAVDAFLKEKISFIGMSDMIERCMQAITYSSNPSIDELVACDAETRSVATNTI
ncbi:MAG: 1-deoxy-D-xylulose-5-phosphate reductoisomerase [Bacteroidetes bacterium]|nr:1-deoxy-D-xylulose-5-phosphate reductoisomerase [Bacteroidota bacterium]